MILSLEYQCIIDEIAFDDEYCFGPGCKTRDPLPLPEPEDDNEEEQLIPASPECNSLLCCTDCYAYLGAFMEFEFKANFLTLETLVFKVS